MCGVHGAVGKRVEDVTRMVEACRHRGPDGSRVWTDERMTLGHNLLAVRGVGQGQQPCPGATGWLTYNGEIYSYGGLTRKSNSPVDTHEVAAQLSRYGGKALDQMDGMYALGWYDEEANTLLLARDKLGAKPLYYTTTGPLIFSSEYRGLFAAGIPKVLDPIGVRLYLQFGYVPGPRTLIAGVAKMLPGERRAYSLTTGQVNRRWVAYNPVPETEYDPQVYRDTLCETVAKCMVSDRPIGMYLSGGLDSASVLWAMAECGYNPETMTMRFEGAKGKQALLDTDCDIAAMLSRKFGTRHTELLFREADYMAGIDAAFSCDEPISRKGMPAYLAAHVEATKKGWVVVFTGDGGDEILSGYGRHIRLIDPNYAKHQFADPIENWVHLQSQGGATPAWRDNAVRDFDVHAYMRSWLPPVLTGDRLRDELLLEGLTHLPEDFLLRSDKLGMSQGLECRFPLLHEPFRSYALGLPSAIKLTGWTLKWCARQAMTGHLPDEVIHKPKSGWGPPTGAWLEGKDALVGPLGERIRATVTPGRFPMLDAMMDVAKVSRIKVRLALFYLFVWAEQNGLAEIPATQEEMCRGDIPTGYSPDREDRHPKNERPRPPVVSEFGHFGSGRPGKDSSSP